MPVGVPKVPFEMPGDDEATWVDLYTRLYRGRFLFLGQEIDTEIANHIMGLIIFLSIEDKKKGQYLFLNCLGGKIIAGLALLDVIQVISPEMTTVNMSMCASMGALILSGGTFTKRVAFLHAKAMIHQPASTFFEAIPGDSSEEREEILVLRYKILNAYKKHTGQPEWIIDRDLDIDRFLSVEEAIEFQLIDGIANQDFAFTLNDTDSSISDRRRRNDGTPETDSGYYYA